jgi:hypothetical protein
MMGDDEVPLICECGGQVEEYYPTYNSVAWISFTVEHDTADPWSASINHIRRRLLSRIADLDDNDEWLDALHFDDTVKGSLHE